jgi:hypothetical protein
MPWLAAVVPAVGGVASGIIQSGAQDRATQAQQRMAREALDFQKNQWATTQTQMAPYMQAGYSALPQMQRIAGEAGSIDPRTDPGYKPLTGLESPGQFNFSTTGDMAVPSYTWRLNQGLNAVNSSAAARGGYFSGNTGKALMDYGQNAASQEYANQFSRYNQMLQNYMGQEGFNADLYNQAYNRQMGMNQNQYNQWAGIAGMGQNAANTTVGAGNQFATNAGNMAMNQGNNAATGAANQADIWSNVISNASNQFMSGWGQQQMLDAIKKNQFSPTTLGPAY